METKPIRLTSFDRKAIPFVEKLLDEIVGNGYMEKTINPITGEAQYQLTHEGADKLVKASHNATRNKYHYF